MRGCVIHKSRNCALSRFTACSFLPFSSWPFNVSQSTCRSTLLHESIMSKVDHARFCVPTSFHFPWLQNKNLAPVNLWHNRFVRQSTRCRRREIDRRAASKKRLRVKGNWREPQHLSDRLLVTSVSVRDRIRRFHSTRHGFLPCHCTGQSVFEQVRLLHPTGFA